MHFRAIGACRRRVSRLAMSGSPGRDVAACLRAFNRSSDDPPGRFLAPGASAVGCHSYRRHPYRKCPFPRWWSCHVAILLVGLALYRFRRWGRKPAISRTRRCRVDVLDISICQQELSGEQNLYGWTLVDRSQTKGPPETSTRRGE